MQAEALDLAGGINVIAPPPAFTGNLVNVSVEDVLLAAPDVIIASDPAFAASVRTARAWRDVRILHPRLFPEPLGPRVMDFHTRYYHRAPTDAQVRTLLEQAGVAQ